jgi:hypothetical protein
MPVFWMYANQPSPRLEQASNVCVNVPLVMAIRLPLLAAVRAVLLVRATRIISDPPNAAVVWIELSGNCTPVEMSEVGI